MNIRIPLLSLLILCSCNNDPQPGSKVVSDPPLPPIEKDSGIPGKIVLKETDLADKKDVVCGMPAFQYLSDTAVYKGKTYGFCSKDCKDEFVKNPESYIAKK